MKEMSMADSNDGNKRKKKYIVTGKKWNMTAMVNGKPVTRNQWPSSINGNETAILISNININGNDNDHGIDINDSHEIVLILSNQHQYSGN